VDPVELQRVLRETAGLRVGPNTADYVAGQLLSPEASTGFFVMGGDARTGRPVRRRITPAMLVEENQDP
jgi:hypothetical protein